MPEEPVILRRKAAQKLLDGPVVNRGFESVASGSAVKNEDIALRAEPHTGLWKQSERSKPGRLMVHVDATDPENPKVTLPGVGGKILGVVNLNTGKKRKALLSFRVYANIKTEDGYKGELGWDWLLWVATKHSLPPDSTSTLVENLDLANGKVTVAKKEQELVGVGFIALCPDDEEAKTMPGLRYGKVSEAIAELLSNESRPKKESVENA